MPCTACRASAKSGTYLQREVSEHLIQRAQRICVLLLLLYQSPSDSDNRSSLKTSSTHLFAFLSSLFVQAARSQFSILTTRWSPVISLKGEDCMLRCRLAFLYNQVTLGLTRLGQATVQQRFVGGPCFQQKRFQIKLELFCLSEVNGLSIMRLFRWNFMLHLCVPLSPLSLLFLKGKGIQFILILSHIFLSPKHAELLVSGGGILLH